MQKLTPTPPSAPHRRPKRIPGWRLFLAALAAFAVPLPLFAQPFATLTSEDITPPFDRFVPGEAIRYTASLGATPSTESVRYTARPPAETRLRVGSVTVSQGTIVRGNTAGDTEVVVDSGPVSGSAFVTITYELEVLAPLSDDVAKIDHQGEVVGEGTLQPIPTDSNPTLPGAQPDSIEVVHKYTVLPRMVDGDASGDGFVAAGESLRYTTEVEIFSETSSIFGSAARYELTFLEHATLVPGTVTTSHGTILQGGTSGDTTVEVSLEDLPTFETATISFEARTVDPLPAGPGEVTAQGRVSTRWDGQVLSDDPAAAGVADPTRTPFGRVDLALGKDDGGLTADAGQSVAYTLTFENRGNIAATGVRLLEQVPAHTRFDAAASSSGWSCQGGGASGADCQLALGTLAAGESGTRSFAVRIDSPLAAGVEVISNTASIEDDGAGGPDPSPANNTASDTTPLGADTAPDLTLEKDDGGATAEPGQVIVYSLTYGNVGNQDATGARLLETVPAHTSFEPGASAPGWACAGSGQAGDTCVFEIGDLPGSDGTVSVDFAVRVEEPLAPGVDLVINQASITDDGANGQDLNPADNSASDSTPLFAFVDLEIVKDDAGLPANPGQPFSYQLTLRNLGTRIATGVAVTEIIPQRTHFDRGGSSPGWSCSSDGGPGDVCTLSLATLDNVARLADLGVRVDDPLPPLQSCLWNVATISDDGAGGADADLANNRAAVLTAVAGRTCNSGPGPDLGVALTDHGLSALPGDLVEYDIAYSNNSGVAAHGLQLTATVPRHTAFDAAASDPDWICEADGGAGQSCRLELGSLAPTGSGMARLALRFAEAIPQGVDEVTLTVFLADDGSNGADTNPADNQASETTPVVAVDPHAGIDLTLTKSDGGARAEPGGVVVYALSYRNAGTLEARGVVIREVIPEHTTFEPSVSAPGWTCAHEGGPGDDCELVLGSLSPGASGSVELAVVVDLELPPNLLRIFNVAQIEDDASQGPDANPADNRAMDETPIARGTVHDIPTVGSLGLALLASSLVVVGWRRLQAATR